MRARDRAAAATGSPQPPSDKVASFFKGVGYFFTGFIVLGIVASSCSGY